jgi:molybdopterin converting factor subunit 1
MRIKVMIKLFAAPREALGTASMEMKLTPEATIATLKEKLFEAHPVLRGYALRFAVNGAYAGDDKVLHQGDEVACIPPVGGG